MTSLSDLTTSGRIQRAQRVTLYGPNGIGKSTLASKFPSPGVIDTEDGSVQLDVTRIKAETVDQLTEALKLLIAGQHEFKTVVVDSIDFVEKFLRQKVCRKQRVDGIESIGFGKGWTFLREEFDRFLGDLDKLITANIHVVVAGHSVVKRVYLPGLADPFDRYELSLYASNAAKLRQWSDAVLFINWDTKVVETPQGRARGTGGKERVIHTTHSAAHDAKNRVGLSEESAV